MAKELQAHLRNEGLQGTLDLHLTHFSECLPRKVLGLPLPMLCPAASSGVRLKPDSTHP